MGRRDQVTKVRRSDGTVIQRAVYDAEGTRILRITSGATTAYLPGGLELTHHTTTANTTARRYYTHAGHTVAVRNGNNRADVTTLFADHHGTAHYAVNNTTSALSIRRQRPFGGPRGTQPAWPGEDGFVGGRTDTDAGLTHIGARPYDPALGQFITVDPILDTQDPQQANGYAYANNNPATYSDPSGLILLEGNSAGGGGIRETKGIHYVPAVESSGSSSAPHPTAPSGRSRSPGASDEVDGGLGRRMLHTSSGPLHFLRCGPTLGALRSQSPSQCFKLA